MSELERLLHNLVSATSNVATSMRGQPLVAAEKQREDAVHELAAYLELRLKPKT